MSIFNNPDFYPTPVHVLDQMTFDVDLKGKVILDPSSGKGDIIDYLLLNGASEVLCCEKCEDLAVISAQKGKLIGKDFLELTSQQISHIHLIIANPPFSEYEKHILHMYEIAPAGCEIITLLNWDSYNNDRNSYSREQSKLHAIIKNYGNILNLGDCFSDAERKTKVNVGLVKLYKPKAESETEFEGYFDLNEEIEDQENGMIKYDEIRNLVNRYIGAVKMFDNVMKVNSDINDLISPIRYDFGIHFGATSQQNSSQNLTREDFKKELQKSAWKSVFRKLKMDKYVTKSVMEDINRFVEQQTKVPFTLKNIYKMVNVIVGTQSQRMEKVVCEIFDKITRHYDENRGGVEGWKTNDQWIVNRKFILPYIIQKEYSGKMGAAYSGETMSDLNKALCYVTGVNYNETQTWLDFMNNEQPTVVIKKYPNPKNPTEKIEYEVKETKRFYREFGVWHTWEFFRIKGYKKGTLHAEFLDEKVWDRFNQVACKAKGWQLPQTTTHDFRKKKQETKTESSIVPLGFVFEMN